MAKRSSRTRKKVQAVDPDATASPVVQEATGEDEARPAKNPAVVELGRLRGKKGGKARVEPPSAKERSAIAKQAARDRWGKRMSEQGR
jgi:hypothetical protein